MHTQRIQPALHVRAAATWHHVGMVPGQAELQQRQVPGINIHWLDSAGHDAAVLCFASYVGVL